MSEDQVEGNLRDPFPEMMGMEIVETGPGYAKVTMTVREDHLNAHAILHGGVYFALSDTAFGMANNYIEEPMVTLNASMDYLASAKLGDELTAICRETAPGHHIRRDDVEIRDQDGKLVALAHSTGYRR